VTFFQHKKEQAPEQGIALNPSPRVATSIVYQSVEMA
jgi:hypothetical protein